MTYMSHEKQLQTSACSLSGWRKDSTTVICPECSMRVQVCYLTACQGWTWHERQYQQGAHGME